MISQKNIQRIKEIGIEIDHQIAFGGKSKGNKHLFRVVKIADHLAKKMKADARIVQAGAWLHDTALPSGNDYDYKKNKRIVQKILSSVPISKGDKNLIAECVASHEGTEGPKTLEARVVHDADVLEKVGLLGLIRHTWKLTNSDKINPSAVKDGDVKKIVDHIAWRRKKLQTPAAKSIEKYLAIPISERDAKKIISISSKLASRGIITEKIAKILYEHLNQKQGEKLKEQLNLAYLKKFK